MNYQHGGHSLRDSFSVYMGKMGLCDVLYMHVTLVVLSLQDGWTPLRCAVSGGHVTGLQLLLDSKAQVNHHDKVTVV